MRITVTPSCKLGGWGAACSPPPSFMHTEWWWARASHHTNLSKWETTPTQVRWTGSLAVTDWRSLQWKKSDERWVVCGKEVAGSHLLLHLPLWGHGRRRPGRGRQTRQWGKLLQPPRLSRSQYCFMDHVGVEPSRGVGRGRGSCKRRKFQSPSFPPSFVG